MNFDEIPEFLRPRLRLFLSVDLVGSTAFKQSGMLPLSKPKDEAAGAHWLSPMAEFYREIESRFSKEWENYTSSVAPKQDWVIDGRPELWKGMGDELIYAKELNSCEEAYACLMTWIKSLRSYRIELRKKHRNLDIKSSAWIAGFPISNAEVIFRSSVGSDSAKIDTGEPRVVHYDLLNRWHTEEEERRHLVRDYIGPSIDTGFRVSSLATPRMLVITIDLCYLLFSFKHPTKLFDRPPIRYGERQILKGVLGGRPYPVFWFDMLHDDPVLQQEDKFTGKDNKLDTEEISKFCEDFIDQNKSHIMRPFIVRDGKNVFGEIPDYYLDHIEHLHDMWKREQEKLKGEEKSIGGNGEGETTSGGTEQDDDLKESEVRKFSKEIPKKADEG